MLLCLACLHLHLLLQMRLLLLLLLGIGDIDRRLRIIPTFLDERTSLAVRHISRAFNGVSAHIA